ncbi:MAG: hypothetical protein LIQ31_09680 [Planctomycetes bacterium]|nr:hypothetical protein [Planctomycetota bacterium]
MGQITELTDVIAISAGYRNSFFLISDGTVWSSGWNSNGQLGRAVDNGGPEKSNLATIPGLFDVKEVNAAFSHSLFLNEGGKLFTCGSNDSGQLARKVESGSYTSINLGEVDKSIKDHGAPLPSPEDEGALFIRHVGPDENCRVRVYDDRFIHLYASPVEVFQVENNLAVEKSFEIRKN